MLHEGTAEELREAYLVRGSVVVLASKHERPLLA